MRGRPQRVEPGPGQESVWDYPRPPRLERTTARLEVVLAGVTIASTTSGWRVLETSHPPTYYLPPDAFLPGSLRPTEGSSTCEWKGRAAYFDLLAPAGGSGGDAEHAPVVAERAAWTYPDPTPAFRDIAGAVALMAGSVDACFVDGERVVPQPGSFYGGWITSWVVGPFKGEPGTWGW